MMDTEPEARVVVVLTPDDVGWPPMATESLRAISLGGDRFRIASAPWFAQNLAVDDVVIARSVGVPADAGAETVGTPVFVEVAEPSEHCTLRLIVHSPDTLAGVADELTVLGLRVEGFAHYSMLAVDVPPGADFAAVALAIVDGERAGRWDWEEGRITARWVAATAAR
ncbi:DUF4265 domain-containing protein [Demequina aurantiaca]|uniref:DUF4265 domain-containing protein n=1 Tax=Demequina aurantiaca TaxID=676200 RepID=UPI003D32F758